MVIPVEKLYKTKFNSLFHLESKRTWMLSSDNYFYWTSDFISLLHAGYTAAEHSKLALY